MKIFRLYMGICFLMSGCVFTAATEELVYTSDDKTGAFRLYVDDLRTLQVSWYGINILGYWPGMYNEGGFDYRTGFRYIYDGDWVGSYSIPTRDVMVEVKRAEGRMEYMWGYNNKEIGCRQWNKVVAFPHKIISDVTLEFTKRPLDNPVFFPSIFPGYRRGSCASEVSADTRLEGTECEIVGADGKTYQKTYPNKKEPERWLWENTRQITVPIRGDKLRFSFSSSDSNTTFQFYSHGGYRARMYAIPSLLGRVTIPAKEGFADKGAYRNTIHLEIADGQEALKPAGSPEEVKLKDDLEISIASGRLANLYVQVRDRKNKELEMLLDNSYCNRKRVVALEYNLTDYDNKLVWEGKDKVKIPRQGKTEKKINIPIGQTGIFSLEVKALEGGKTIGIKLIRIGVVPAPYDYPSEKSFFGAMWLVPDSFPRTEAEWKGLDERCKLAYNLGIKRIRYNILSQMTWPRVEPQDGKFNFDTRILECLDLMRKNKLDIHLAATPYDLDLPFPEWALDDKKLEVRPGMTVRIPKISFYERYMFEVARFLEGRVKEFELENEFICPQYLTGADLDLYYSLREAQAKGVRRGNPEAIVISSSFGDATEKVLADTQKRGYRIYDIYAPHSGSADETSIEGLKKSVQLAEKNKVGFWDGEHNDVVLARIGFRVMYPHKIFQDYEKERVNATVKSDIIEKACGVAYVSRCFSLLGFPVPERYEGIFGNRYLGRDEFYPGMGSAFFGFGGNIQPNAVASAVCASLLDGAVFKERITLPSEETYCFLFERNGSPIAFLWAKRGKVKAELNLTEEQVDVLNIMGNKLNKGVTAEFDITEEPVYLAGRRIETNVMTEAIRGIKGSIYK